MNEYLKDKYTDLSKFYMYLIDKYLIDFVIGSSIIVTIPFLVKTYDLIKENHMFKKKLNFLDFKTYAIFTPLFFGWANTFGAMIQDGLKLSNNERFLFSAILSFSIISSVIYYYQIYRYTNFEWFKHISCLVFFHLFIWFCVINYLNAIIFKVPLKLNELAVIGIIWIISGTLFCLFG